MGESSSNISEPEWATSWALNDSRDAVYNVGPVVLLGSTSKSGKGRDKV